MALKQTKQQMACKIKQGDTVIVIAGKDKGKQGEVKSVLRKGTQAKLLVVGINLMKKHVKPNPNKGIEGGIVSQEAYIDASNVKIYNLTEKKGDRIGYRHLEDGKKVRYFKSTGDVIDSDV